MNYTEQQIEPVTQEYIDKLRVDYAKCGVLPDRPVTRTGRLLKAVPVLLDEIARCRTTPAPSLPNESQHSELADRLEHLAVALSDGGWEKSMDLVHEAAAALRQPPSDAMRSALVIAREYVQNVVDAEGKAFNVRDLAIIDAALTQGKGDQ